MVGKVCEVTEGRTLLVITQVSSGVKLQEVLSGLEKKAKTLDMHMYFCGFSQHSLLFFLPFGVEFSSLTAVSSENKCMSLGAYGWPVLVTLKHGVGLSQHWFSNCSFTVAVVQRKRQQANRMQSNL